MKLFTILSTHYNDTCNICRYIYSVVLCTSCQVIRYFAWILSAETQRPTGISAVYNIISNYLHIDMANFVVSGIAIMSDF